MEKTKILRKEVEPVEESEEDVPEE